MTLRTNPKPVFVSAILLLCLCAVASYLSFSYFRSSEHWVAHTQEVRVTTADVDAAINNAARDRMTYMLQGTADSLDRYRSQVGQIQERIGKLKNLVADNVRETANVKQFERATQDRLQVWEESIAKKQRGEPTD